MISTIELNDRVISQDLCTNCGACQGLCPYWTSEKGKTRSIFDCNRENGRCLHFCPRMPADLDALRKKCFEETEIIPELGPFKALYLARAVDPKIREHSQHGGCMSALVKLALEEGLIDAALLAKTRETLDAAAILTDDPQKVLESAGSSFQIPPSLGVLNRALKEDKYHRIGVVGTPCKTLAVYKMKSLPFPEDTNHAENIGMVFGLFCGWGLDWEGLDALARRHAGGARILHMDILPSKYHCLEIKTDKGLISVDLEEIYPLVRKSCSFCDDMTAEYADISVGGARSRDGWDVDKGWNQIIVRSDKGADLLALAREKGILEFKELPEGALEKLKKASQGKKKTAERNLQNAGKGR